MPFAKNFTMPNGVTYGYIRADRFDFIDEVTQEARFRFTIYPSQAIAATNAGGAAFGSVWVKGAAFQLYFSEAAMAAAATAGKSAHAVADQIVQDYLAALAAQAALAVTPQPTPPPPALTTAQQALVALGNVWIENGFGGATAFQGATVAS